ncbi:MAG: hypothetical protein CL610_18065 [Anaerolineaceae bacterium]|nr:hypothetical protein [Anaerolineaceae bacterium]
MSGTQRSGMLFVLAGAVGYALLPVWVKNIQLSGLQPLDIATWRFLFAMPLIWALLLGLRTTPPATPLPRRKLLGLGVLQVIAATSAFVGLQNLPASTMVLLFYTYPAMVALINFALGERMPLQSWLALVITLVGVSLTVPDFGTGLDEGAGTGVIFAFINALVVAVYFILNNRVMRGHRAMGRGSAWTITGAFLMMLVILLVRGGAAVPPDARTWLLLLALALFSTVFPIFMLMNGIQRLGASRAAILSTVEPIGTLTLAALFLGERVQPVQLLGGGLILLSVLLLQLSNRKPAPVVVPAAGD